MEIFLKIFAVLSPFISALIVYLLSIKGKKKETDFQKEKELNIVLSNLLMVWHYLTRIEMLFDLMNNQNVDSIIPKKYLPIIILKTGVLNDRCFQDLDDSIDILKKYDPILYFTLEGIGNTNNIIRKKFIMPFLQITNTQIDFKKLGTEGLLNNTLNDLEINLKFVAKKISSYTLAETKNHIENYLETDIENILEEINESYYEVMINMISFEQGKKPTLKEFIELTKTDEYKKVLEAQFSILINDQLEEYIDIISNNPNITIEELQTEINKNDKLQ